MFERLVYVSQAAPGNDAAVTYDIIRTAHNRNSQCGLTGALILLDGHYLQLLEGEGPRLRDRFAVIEADPRHGNVSVRHWEVVEERLFPNDWMAWRQGGANPAVTALPPGYSPGFPKDRFDGPALLDYIVQVCRGQDAA